MLFVSFLYLILFTAFQFATVFGFPTSSHTTDLLQMHHLYELGGDTLAQTLPTVVLNKTHC